MLQRQMMFKQLQEMQRRQQMQELGDNRNQNYMNQNSSSRQPSGGQFPPTVNGTPVHNPSQMFMHGNIQMQQAGSGAVQGMPNGFGFQPTNHQPQFDTPFYGTPAQNMDKNFNQYSHLQGPSNIPGNMFGKNNNSALGPSGMEPSMFGSSFMGQQGNFSSDQLSMQHGAMIPSQAIQEKNLFDQGPAHSGSFSGSYSEQGNRTYRNLPILESEGRLDGAAWRGVPPGKTSKLDLFQSAASLDPLEEKILFNSDDNGWESFSKSCKMASEGFEGTAQPTSYTDELSSLQSGSWSALMQSAVAETSSGDTGIQEEWSGLSFQNPEQSENRSSNIINNEVPHNNWVNRNSQNTSSPRSKQDNVLHNSNMSSNFPGFLQSGQQYLKQKEAFHSDSAPTSHSPRNMSHLGDYNSQQKNPASRTQLFQTPPASSWSGRQMDHSNNDVHQPSIFPTNDNHSRNYMTGDEARGNVWHHESTPHNLAGGIQKPFEQAKNLNTHGYSAGSQKMSSENNVELMSTLFGDSSDFHDRNETSQSENMIELLNKDDPRDDHASGVNSNSLVSTPNGLTLTESPVASLAKSSNASVSQGRSFMGGQADSQTPQSYSFFPSLSMGNSSAATLASQNVNDYVKNQSPAPLLQGHVASRFPVLENMPLTQPSMSGAASQHVGLPTRLPTSWADTNTLQDVQSMRPNKFSNLFRHPDAASSTLDTSSGAQIELPNQKSLIQNHSLQQQFHSPRNPETEYGKGSPLRYDGVNSQPAIAKAGDLFSSGQKTGVQEAAKVDSESALKPAPPSSNRGLNFSQESSSKANLQNFQRKDMFAQNDTQYHSTISNEASTATHQSQISAQMAPSWFKHYGNSLDAQKLPSYTQKATVNASQPFSGMTQGHLQENNSSIVQVNSAIAFQGSNMWPPVVPPSIASKPVDSISDLSYQSIVPAVPKKRKMVAFDMVPWHKEVNYEQSRIQIISSMADLQWTHASNSKPEQAKFEAESVEDMMLPVARAKRRLLSTTQLMQQVFKPPPGAIFKDKDSSNCYNIAFSAARLALGDACSLTRKSTPDTNEASSDKVKTSNKTDFSKVVEVIVSQVQKLEDNLTRVEKSFSISDIKMELQELEKFGMINRFARFHIKAQQSQAADSGSTSGPSTTPKINPQRYVTAAPMPKTLPEGVNCLSL